MAIDSTLFVASIPAGTYSVGDVVKMSVIRGPAVVRDGYGEPYLKKIFSITNEPQMIGHVVVKNSNWVDEVDNITPTNGTTILASNSSGIQSGHNSKLQPNSGWDVSYVVDVAITTTAAYDVAAIIDIDYPAVQAIANPKQAQGTPASNIRRDSYTVTATGSSPSIVWTTYNVDILKAGYRYLLASTYFRGANSTNIGFFSISGAAGQSGLERIIPVLPNTTLNLRYDIDYSTPLVKGPFNINYAALGTAGADTAVLEIDWVKR